MSSILQEFERQSSSYKWDTELTTIGYVNRAQVLFLFTFSFFSFLPEMNVTNARIYVQNLLADIKKSYKKNLFHCKLNQF